ncbi:hypothetical protein [Terrabacter sp. Root181]|uniref:hypothetical protein n=1 Tax=Terrabacter sp. Root181 TaxID=1736484 RepID=UPI0006FA83C5|nr:hypothetical protein [Terrabacter sp. Root181]KRB42984.1 hypothetical protein ASD90_21585 [Terrabacter sp. Root181]
MTSVVVPTWRPADAVCLQQALRLTNEAFAETLGSAARTVAKWHANPAMKLTTEMQAALDTLLSRAAEDARERFAQLRFAGVAEPAAVTESATALQGAEHLHSALEFLDELRGCAPGTSFEAVAKRAITLSRDDPIAHVDRQDVADRLVDFYSTESGLAGAMHLQSSEGVMTTTLVTPHGGLAPRNMGVPSSGFARRTAAAPLLATPALLAAAETRLARCLLGGTRFSDQPTYRLVDVDHESGGIRTQFAMTTFARYALTWDLLEAEVLTALAAGTSVLPLREQLLPTARAVLTPSARECVGGALALSAFARPASGNRPADYVLLIQQRSSRVLNGAGRIAVIPKCFHQPTNEATAEVDVRLTLLRETEEELFGRAETDNSLGPSSVADLLHPSRMTPAMRWLTESSALDVHLNGFAYNLVAGSFEFPALLAVHDETFWQRFGGDVEANWEASGLLRYSSADADGLEALLHDPQWTDEGLVAFALGLKRLAQLNPERVKLPALQIGVS